MIKARLMIVEDEAIIAMEMESQLLSLGYEVTSIVDTGEKAIRKAEEDKPDIIMMDIRINGEMDGIETADVIRNGSGIPVVFSTAYLDQERIERAKITMPFGYVLKPIQEQDLKVTIEMALYTAMVDRDRRKTEKLLKENENRLSTIYNTTSNYMCLLEVNLPDCFKFVSLNDAYGTGIKLVNPKISLEDIIGLRIEELGALVNWPDSVAESIKQSYKIAIQTKKSVKVIDIIPAQEGNLYLESIYTPIFNENGKCTHILFVSNDITEWKKKENELLTKLEEKETMLKELQGKIR